jgi:hypothetical protein
MSRIMKKAQLDNRKMAIRCIIAFLIVLVIVSVLSQTDIISKMTSAATGSAVAEQNSNDNFFVEEGWSTYGTGNNNWSVKTEEPYSGTYYAQVMYTGSSKYSYLEAAIDTSGYNDITFTYYRQLLEMDSADGFSAEWWDGAGWNIVESVTTADDASYVYKNFALPSGASDNPDFRIRFVCEADAEDEGCRVDNVEINGGISTDSWLYMHNTSGMSAGEHNYTVHATDNYNNTAYLTGTFIAE